MPWIMLLAKSRLVRCLFLILITVPLIAFAAEGHDPSAQTKIKALEQEWLENEDRPEALEGILADDFVHVLPSGMITKREQIEYLKAHPQPSSGAKSFESMRTRIYGTIAIVNGIVRATRPSQPPLRTAFTDVFAYRNGRWQAVNAQELPLQQ